MKSVLVLAFALMVESGCCGRIADPPKSDSLNQGTRMPVNSIVTPEVARTDVSEQPKQIKEAPPAFRRIDFKNLSYPISWKNERVSLQDGKREYYHHKNLGNGWFELSSVDYVDITGNEREEAVVVLDAVLCGVSCDGGSHLFYFYSVEKGKLRLLWRFETGSLGYGCGLKSFHLGERKITLEVFNPCIFNGATLEPLHDPEQSGGKFHANSHTRLDFKFHGRKPALNKREIVPAHQEDLRNYRAKISITND